MLITLGAASTSSRAGRGASISWKLKSLFYSFIADWLGFTGSVYSSTWIAGSSSGGCGAKIYLKIIASHSISAHAKMFKEWALSSFHIDLATTQIRTWILLQLSWCWVSSRRASLPWHWTTEFITLNRVASKRQNVKSILNISVKSIWKETLSVAEDTASPASFQMRSWYTPWEIWQWLSGYE